MRATSSLALLLAATAVVGCSEELTQEDTPPKVIAVGPVELSGARTVLVTYALTDLEGDDATLEALVCRGDACTPAVQGSGGDGLVRLPTIPERRGEQSVTHVFSWDVACGSIDVSTGEYISVSLDEEIAVGFRLAGADTAPVTSPAFTLSSLGYESVDGSGMLPACQDD